MVRDGFVEWDFHKTARLLETTKHRWKRALLERILESRYYLINVMLSHLLAKHLG